MTTYLLCLFALTLSNSGCCGTLEIQKGTSENARSSAHDPAVDEITTGAKALDMGSGSVDEPTVKVKQETMNKPADQI
ncbi:hypothetical protein ACFX1Q_035279 [Malus domestica]